MKKIDAVWKIFISYILVVFFILLANNALCQMKVIQFNAGWNNANQVSWLDKLSDCDKDFVDVGTDKEAQKKYQIAVIPTIILFKDGEEVKRFQADLSFKMVATKEEVQEEIDNQLMSDF